MRTQTNGRHARIINTMTDAITLLMWERNHEGYTVAQRQRIADVYTAQWEANRLACATFYPSERAILRPKAA